MRSGVRSATSARTWNTDEDRSDGSCRWTGTNPPVDLGPCEGFVDALDHDLAGDPELRLAFRLSQCTQPARSPSDCTTLHGHTSYLTAVASVPAAACGAGGSTVELDDASSTPVPVPASALLLAGGLAGLAGTLQVSARSRRRAGAA